VDFLERIYLLICPSVTVTAIALIIYAVFKRSMTPLQGAYLGLVFALFALSFTLFLTLTLGRRDRLRIESNWGGLGGGLSGWSVSNSLTFLLLSGGFLALLVVASGTDKPQVDVRERYRTALTFAALNGIKFDKTAVVDGKLLLKGTAPSQTVVDEFWNQVKLTNPLHDDVEPDLTVKAPTAGSSAGEPVK
jgi:hypothetical protein